MLPRRQSLRRALRSPTIGAVSTSGARVVGTPIRFSSIIRSTRPRKTRARPGFLWQGEGNPAITLQRKRNTYAGIELAIKDILRGGPDQPPTYVDSSGVVHIEVPSGEQLPGNNRAKWNFTYSYDVALNPTNPVLSGYEAFLLVDLDPRGRPRYRPASVKLVPYPNFPGAAAGDYNGYGWKEGTTIRIPDDEGTEQVTQNSQNLGFSYYLIGSMAIRILRAFSPITSRLGSSMSRCS